MVHSDLVGKYMMFPDDGDAGIIRAVFVARESLYVLVQRDNSSRDFKVYFAVDMKEAPARPGIDWDL